MTRSARQEAAANDRETERVASTTAHETGDIARSRETLDLEGDDQAQFGQRNRSGVRIETTEAIDGLTCRLSRETIGVVTAYLTDDGGTVLERQTIATVGPGETFAFESQLDADAAYWILCDAHERAYVRGRAAVDYPLEAGPLVATHGIYTDGGTRSNSYRYCIDRIRPGHEHDAVGTALDLGGDDEAQLGQRNRSGVRIEPTQTLRGLACRLSSETDGVTTAYLTDDGGTILEERAIADLESGETFAFESELEAGENYWVLCDADGRSYVRGRAAVDYPLENDALAATHGIYTDGGTRSNSYRYCIDRLETVGAETGATLALGTDDRGQSWSSLTDRSGVRIETTEAIDGLTCRLSSETDGVMTAYLTTDDGTVLERQTIATYDAGETFAFESRLEADAAYRILCDARGRAYVRGRTAIEYPVESDALVATHGVYSGAALSDGYRYCFDRIAPADSGPFAETEAETIDLGGDRTAQWWSGLTTPSGVRIETDEELVRLEGRLSAETDGVTTAYLTDDEGAVLAEQSIADLEPGETFAFDRELEADTAYWLVCDADGESYVRGRAPLEYPLEGATLDVTHGIYGGDLQSNSYRYCIDRLWTTAAGEGSDALGLGGDDAVETDSGRAGVRIETTAAVGELECRLSAETDASRAYVTDDEGTVLAQQSIADLEPGETFAFDRELEADAAYWILCDGDGADYARGRAAIDYPIASDRLVATHGIHDGDLRSRSFRFCIDRIRTSPARRGLLADLENRSISVTTVDVVNHPSIDENGDLAAELLDYLEAQNAVNHEIVLPEGSYDWNTAFSITAPVEFLAIRGEPRATLEIRNDNVSTAFRFGRWGNDDPPRHVVVQNVDVDISDEPQRDAALLIAHADRYLVDNVELVGQRDLHGPAAGNRYTLLACTRDEEATSIVRNVGAVDGEVEDPNEPLVGSHTIGFSADPPHEGINVWDRCLVADFVGSGYYVRNSPGDNVMERTAATNCAIRIGEADEARDCKVAYDDISDRKYAGTSLWLNGGEPIAERIELDGTDAQNDILRINSTTDSGHVRDLDVFCGPNAVAPTVRCTQTSETDPQGVLIEDFEIEDVTTASTNPSVIVSRPDVTFRSGTIAVRHRSAIGGTHEPTLEDVEIE